MFATSPELGEELEAVEYEWEVLEPLVNEPPTHAHRRRPGEQQQPVMFEFTGTDDLTPPTRLVFECGLDTTNPVEFTECVSPFNVLELTGPEGLSAGQHTFAVRAVDETDPDGQPDPTPATYTWTHVLDTVAPQTVVLGGPPLRIVEETPAEITFTGTDNSTPAPPLDPEAVVPEFSLEFQCSLDGAGWTSCESPQDHTGLEPGVHALAVRAIDTRGNTDLSPAVHSWTVVGPPVTTFTSTPPLEHGVDDGDVQLDHRPVASDLHLHAQRRRRGAVRARDHDHRPVGTGHRLHVRGHGDQRVRARRGAAGELHLGRPGPSRTRPHPTRRSSTSRWR